MNEFAQQKDLVAKFKSEYQAYKKCVRVSMNGINLGGSKKASRMINQMKSQGMVIGESDLLFTVPTDEFHGLFIELKGDKKTPVSQDQIDYLEFMASLGYAAMLCVGLEQAWQTLNDYMGNAKTPAEAAA